MYCPWDWQYGPACYKFVPQVVTVINIDITIMFANGCLRGLTDESARTGRVRALLTAARSAVTAGHAATALEVHDMARVCM
jgi:hypothetical protein